MPSERIQRRIDTLLDEADAAFARREWAAVRQYAADVLRLDPDNADARTFLAAAADDEAAATPQPAGDSPVTARPTPAPASFAVERYQVVRILGEGATKKVYLAHDTRLGRDVALGVIRVDALDEAGMARVRREAQAMARLGDHPNVVAVYDIGEEQGQPYIVSQLMQGGDVEGLLKGADDHRLPLEQAIRIADQLCAALEHAHQHGIVHRDLKPGNAWLTQDGTAKLGDFGLAIALDRSRLTQAGMMVGTVSYMPPEQALAGEVTPRSDLYALGCMLYEMVCGRPPFVADESIAIITQHLNIPPIAPTWHRPDCPPSLEALILRLLEKDPTKRPASAAEVRRLLAAIDLSPVVHTGLTQVQPAPYGAQVNPLYRRTFVGREPELRQLQTAFDAVLSGNGGLVLVVGEPGIGKTALCEQLATYASVRGGRTIAGHCYEEGSFSLPYLAFVEAIRTYVLNRPPEELLEELGSGAADVARIVSEVRERVAVEIRQPGDPEEDRWRLLQAITEFLRSASTSQPLVLVLEDLHWADRGTLDLLQHLARNLAGARLLIIGTYRDVEVDRAHPLAAALAELRRTATVNRVLLRGLTPDEVQRMLAGLADQEVPWGLAEAVHRQTEGNPLFIQEVIRYLVEEGLLSREDGRWRRAGDQPLAMSIPEGLRDVIGRRLDRLSSECNRLLTIAAVIGRDFTVETLQTVANQPEDAVLAGLEEAVRVGVVEEQSRPGTVSYRFAHAFFRQTLYEEMIAPRRIRLHQQIARTLEQQYAARLEDHAAELADHFGQSSDPSDLAKAVQYSELGAQRASMVHAYSETVRLLEQALEIQEVLDSENKLRRCDLLLALCDALGPAGEPQRVFAVVAEEAFTLAEGSGERSRAARAARTALEAVGQYGGPAMRDTPAQRLWTDRLDRVAEPETLERAIADTELGLVAERNFEFRKGRVLGKQGLELARRLGNPYALFRTATFFLRFAPPQYWREQLALAEEISNLPHQGVPSRILTQTLFYLGKAFLNAGQREQAENIWRQLKDVAVRTNEPLSILQSLQVEGIGLAETDGRLEEAIAAARALVTQAEASGSAPYGWQMGLLIGPLQRLGRVEEAVETFGEASRMTGGGLSINRRAIRALMWAAAGRLDDARQALQNQLAGYRLGTPDEDEIRIEVLAMLLEAAVIIEEREIATLLADRLADASPFAIDPAYGVRCVRRILGDAAIFSGDSVHAKKHYAQALEDCARIRHRPETALARLGLAELYAAEGHSAATNEHLDFCIPEFEAMKMRPALEKALKLKETLDAE